MPTVEDSTDTRIIPIEQITSKFITGEHYRPASLTRYYGPHWWWVLDDFFTDYIPESNPNGGNRILIGAPMPNKETFDKMRDEYFTKPIEELLGEASSEVAELQSEMEDWYNNLPENFQYSDKGDAIQAASDALGAVEIPCGDDIPENCRAITALHLVLPDRSSRGRRLDEICKALEDCAKACAAINPNFASELEGFVCELESIEFPGMFS